MKNKVKKIALSVLSLAMAAITTTSFAIQIPLANKEHGGLGGGNTVAKADGNFTRLSDEYAASMDTTQFLNQDIVNSLATLAKNDDGTRRIIVEFESKSQLDLYLENKTIQNSYEDFTSYVNAAAGKAYAKDLTAEQRDFFKQLDKTSLDYEARYAYTSILNAVSLVVKDKDIATISKLEGVKNIILSEVYAQPTVEPTINVVDVYSTGIYSADVDYKGDGMLVSVLDSGFDIAHDAFRTMPTVEKLQLDGVKEVFNSLEASRYSGNVTAEDVYYNAKVPFAYDYADKDSDVFAIANSHGVHVAGIIAGYEEGVTEEDDKAFKDNHTFIGVAPNAQLMIGKVFSDKNTEKGAQTDDILAAVADSVTIGADVINMSLGMSCGFSREKDGSNVNAIYDKVYAAGVNLVVAAGNEASSAQGGAYGSTNLTSNPDSSTVGSPAAYHSSLSVASISGQKSPYMLLNDGTAVYFMESSEASGKQGRFVEELLNGTAKKDFNFVVVPGYGRTGDYSAKVKTELNKGNCIAVVSRGDISFEEKQENAFNNGAVACIIYNNMSGKIAASLGTGKKIPTCTVSAVIGRKFEEIGKGTISLDETLKAGPFMSDFSSWGPTNDLQIKPEITAHGGEITSAVVGGYAQYSGTSMASPNMAGAVTLLRQHVAQTQGLTGIALANRVNQLLMSTATIVKDENGLPYAVRRQGAGLGDIGKAISTDAYIYVENSPKTKLELGDDPDRTGLYTMEFHVENLSSDTQTYTLDVIAMTESVSIDNITVEEKAYLLNKAQKIFRVNGEYAKNNKITLEGGEDAVITATLLLSAEEKAYMDANFKNGMYVEGFVALTAEGDGVDLSIPYLAFYGDWKDAPLFDVSAYEVSKDFYDSSIKEEDKIIAAIYESIVIGRAYKQYSEFYLPLGQYLYNMPNDADPGVEKSVDKIAIGNSYYGIFELYAFYMGMLRAAGEMNIHIENAATGEVLFDTIEYNIRKSYSAGPSVTKVELSAEELGLLNNEKYTITLTATADYDSETVKSETREFAFYVDYQAPMLHSSNIRYEDNSDGTRRAFLDLEIYDNHYPQSVQLFAALSDTEADFVSTYSVPVKETVRDGVSKVSIDVTDYLSNFANAPGEYKNKIGVRMDDYALNASAYLVDINTTLVDEALFQYVYEDENGDEAVASLAGQTISLRPGQSVDLTEDAGYVVTADGGTLDVEFKTTLVGYTGYQCVNLDAHGLECGYTYDERAGLKYAKGDYYYADGTVAQKEADDAEYTYAAYTRFFDVIAEPIVKNGNRYTEPATKNFVCPKCGEEATFSFNSRSGKLTPNTFKNLTQDPMIHDVIFTSSNEDVVKVYNGFLYAVSAGEATITAHPSNWEDNSKDVTFNVSVGGKATDVLIEGLTVGSFYNVTDEVTRTVSAGGISIDCGKELILYPKFDPWYITEIPDLTWRSSDPSVVSIEACDAKSATVLCKKPGTVYIYISSPSNGLIGNFVINTKDEYLMTSYYLREYNGVGYSETYTDENGDTRNMLVIPANLGIVIMGMYSSGVNYDGTFENVKNLDTVVVPQGVTSIGSDCFRGTSIRRIYLPSSIEQISSSAFYETPIEEVLWYDAGEDSKSKIEYDSDNNTYNWEVFFKEVKDNKGASTAKRIVLNYSAFAGCEQLKVFDFSRVTAAFSYAMENCKSLTYADLTNLRYAETGLFSGCSNLTSITTNADTALSNSAFANTGLTEIDYYGPTIVKGLFSNIKNLQKVVIHNNITAVGENAFKGCTNLTEVVFEGSCQTIAASAFEGCTSLETIALPKGVKTVGNKAFKDCTKLETLTVHPDSNIQSVGSEVFSGCANLTTVKVEKDATSNNYNTKTNNNYTMLTNKNGTLIIMMPPKYTLETNGNVFTVSATVGTEKVTEINPYTYEKNSFLNGKEVVIEEGVTKIGAGAFQGSMIKKVIIPSTVTEIDKYAFSGCTNLETVVLLCDLTEISEGVFNGCTKLNNVQIPGTVENIGAKAFYKTDLRTVYIGENVQEIGTDAFRDCTSLVEVNFAKQSVLHTIGEASFAGCTALAKVDMPNTVTTLKNNAFLQCSALTEVYVSAGLEVMEEYVFALNPALEKVVFGNGAKVVGDYAFFLPVGSKPEQGFYYHTMLSSVTIPASIETIGKFAFAGNAVLATLDLKNVQEIGDYAFHYATRLNRVRNNGKVERIGVNAFAGSAIQTFDNIQNVKYFDNQAFMDTNITLTTESLKNAVEVGSGAFYNCSNITWVSLPNAVRIGDMAFGTNKTNQFTGVGTLKQVVNLLKLESLGATAFSNQPVETIALPATLKEVKEAAFIGMPNLQTITVAEGNEIFFVDEEGGLYRNLANGTYELMAVPNGLGMKDQKGTGYRTIDEDYTKLVPFKIKEGTSRIAAWAMGYCWYIHAVEIPASVKTIGTYAFYYVGYGVLVENESMVATSRAPYTKFIFKGLQAPALESEYAEESTALDQMYATFVYTMGYLMSDMVIPVNAKGFESDLYRWFFMNKEYSEELIESDTKKLSDWLATLDVAALTVEDAKTVTEMNMIYFMMSDSQKAFISEENANKLAAAVAKIAELQA